MFRDRVVAHYVHRGYTVEADKVIEGESGSPHRVDLACHSDLGDLVVFFGDEEPYAGPEVASLKRAASDLGAGAVVAVPEATAALKAAAREHRVVLLDDVALGGGPKDEAPLIETIDVPEVRAKPVAAATAPLAVPEDRVGAFDWLPDEEEEGVAVPVAPVKKAAGIPLHWIWGPLLYLTVTLVLVIVGALVFL